MQRSADSAALADGSLRPRPNATGGNTVAGAQVELRVDAGLWRPSAAGAVRGQRHAVRAGQEELSSLRYVVTPGVGLRVATPLGPMRLDVAYNGYDQQSGPLYLAKSDGSLDRVRDRYTQPRGGHWTWHFSFGEPF